MFIQNTHTQKKRKKKKEKEKKKKRKLKIFSILNFFFKKLRGRPIWLLNLIKNLFSNFFYAILEITSRACKL
jgi:bifunctional DNase/RNase